MTRRQALAASSPGLRGLLLGLGAVCVLSGVTVALNVVDICRRRDEWG